jgi:hypothetical protein
MARTALLLLTLQAPLAAVDFRRFGAIELGAQATSGAMCAGLGYLFLQSSVQLENPAGQLSPVAAIAGLSIGYSLGILFSGKIFRTSGNPFATLAGNIVPFFGPLAAYHLSVGSHLFTESLALFNLHGDHLAFGLPLPFRKASRFDQPGDTIYYVHLATITF